MKTLKYPSTAQDHAYLKSLQNVNIRKSISNKTENWAATHLLRTGKQWSRQSNWGFRFFDFWCHALGCAVEIDGPEHNKQIDAYRDEYNFRRSGIIVLRVRNNNESDMVAALSTIAKLGPWKERRVELKLNGKTKAEKRHLAKMPYEAGSLLNSYLNSLSARPGL